MGDEPPVSFQLRFERCDPDRIDTALLSRCVASLIEPLDDVRGLVIVVAGDFGAAVRARSDSDYAERYDPHRTTGLAVAKTMPRPDGTCDVVVNSALVASGTPEQIDTRRLFAHEGYHVLMWQRGDQSPRIQLPVDIPRQAFSGQAAYMLEEFRVERALNERAWWPDAGYRETITEILTALASRCRAGVVQLYPGEPIGRCFESVMSSFIEMTTHFSYVAAEHIVSQGERSFPAAEGWSRFVGNYWPSLLGALAVAPSASTTTDATTREHTIYEIANLLDNWLNYIGFDFRQTPEGPYFEVLRHDF